MEKYSIGFRMKFDDIKTEDLERVITNYLENFHRYEIKVSRNLVFSGKIDTLINVSERLAKGRYSLHLLKDVLSSPKSYAEMRRLLKLLQHHRSSNEIYLVTHIPCINATDYIKIVLSISRNLPPNYILLLENAEVCSGNYKYLQEINELFYILNKKKIRNVGVCLDIGHLLFGFYKEGITEEQGLYYLEKMTYLLSVTKEIHIHDYHEMDHLQLQQGLMNLRIVSNFIVKYDLAVPIIIEVTVKEPNKDGIRQITEMIESLRR